MICVVSLFWATSLVFEVRQPINFSDILGKLWHFLPRPGYSWAGSHQFIGVRESVSTSTNIMVLMGLVCWVLGTCWNVHISIGSILSQRFARTSVITKRYLIIMDYCVWIPLIHLIVQVFPNMSRHMILSAEANMILLGLLGIAGSSILPFPRNYLDIASPDAHLYRSIWCLHIP